MTSELEQIFGSFIAAHQRLASALRDNSHPERRIEQLLLAYLRSLGVSIVDVAGEPHVDVVRHFEAEEAITARLSLEDLSDFLTREFPH